MENQEATKKGFEATPEQIEGWKKEHGQIFKVEVDGRVAFLKKPGRHAISYASTVGQKDPIKFNEIILQHCWLAGDEEIKTDDELFMGVGAQLSELIVIKAATLEKL